MPKFHVFAEQTTTNNSKYFDLSITLRNGGIGKQVPVHMRTVHSKNSSFFSSVREQIWASVQTKIK